MKKAYQEAVLVIVLFAFSQSASLLGESRFLLTINI